MAIKKAAKKSIKRSKKLAERNSFFKVRMKKSIKMFIKKLEKWEKVTNEDLWEVYKNIDKCLKIWLIHKNNASRKKSRIAKIYNKSLDIKTS